MKAKKSLGQNFLRSEKALASIINAGDLKADDIILEIGPGKGVLTERLLAQGSRVIAVEKDDELYELLKDKFADYISSLQLTLVHDDILDYQLHATSYKLIANIPYNITGAILRKFLSADYQPERMVLLVQKEVAERIVARDHKESILSISIKAYGKPKYIETVKAGSFVPAPSVDSAILLIEDISKDFFENFSEDKFFELVRAGFLSKRKKLSSNLSSLIPKTRVEEVFASLGLDTNTRAEDLGIDIWKKLGVSLLK